MKVAPWIVVVCCVACVAPAQTRPSGLVPAQPRVTWTESPQTRAMVSWTTADEGVAHRVHYDTEPRDADPASYRWVVDCQKTGQFSGGGPLLDYHHAQLTGLQPATTYYLVLASDDEVSREYHFRTAPAEDVEFAILSGGDSRSDREARRQMNRVMAQLVAGDDSILALAHGGDYVYWGTSLKQWSAWLTDHELMVTPSGRLLPVIPARGNHEAQGQLYDEVFGWPGGGYGKNYFATQLSPAVTLITLNSEVAAGGDQLAFLLRALQAAEDRRWKVVQVHRAIFPAVKSPDRAKQHWQAPFEEHGVDLVCESDGHALKRTAAIRGEQRDRDGVVYIGEGGLGVKQRTPQAGRWYLDAPGVAMRGHHVWVLRFGPDRLQLEAIGIEGQPLDRAELTAR